LKPMTNPSCRKACSDCSGAGCVGSAACACNPTQTTEHT
jgi:hypothetical protein